MLMKPNLSSINFSLILLLFLQSPYFVKADSSESQPFSGLHRKCKAAVSMNCQILDRLSSNFRNGGEVVDLYPESCIVPSGQGILSESWLSLELSGSSVYYLDGFGVNAGIEIYTGSCNNLEMVDCVGPLGDDTFIGFFPPVSAQYFIRLLGYDTPGSDKFEVVLNCDVPGPACEISIDNLEIGTCVSKEGTVSLSMSGVVVPEPDEPLIFAEVSTDAGFYMVTGESVNGHWEASFEVSGTVVNFVSVFCGNSENGCSDVLVGGDLPSKPCHSLNVPSFTFSINWGVNCGTRTGEMKLYEPGTNILVETYAIKVLNNGLFEIENALSGTYDIILTIKGFLPKGFKNVEISLTENSYDCGLPKQGDINGDGVIDMLDLDILAVWFSVVLPSDNSMDHLDQNCDGTIDIIDLTSIVMSFGYVGDSVPID